MNSLPFGVSAYGGIVHPFVPVVHTNGAFVRVVAYPVNPLQPQQLQLQVQQPNVQPQQQLQQQQLQQQQQQQPQQQNTYIVNNNYTVINNYNQQRHPRPMQPYIPNHLR